MNIDNNFKSILDLYNPKYRKSHSILRFFSEDLSEIEKEEFISSIFNYNSWILTTEISIDSSTELKLFTKNKFKDIFYEWVTERIEHNSTLEDNKKIPFIPHNIVAGFREALISTKNLGFPKDIMDIYKRLFLNCDNFYIKRILEESCWLVVDEFNVNQIEVFFNYFLNIYLDSGSIQLLEFFYVFLNNLAYSPEIFNLSNEFISKLKILSNSLYYKESQTDYYILITRLLIHYIDNKDLNLRIEFNSEINVVLMNLDRGSHDSLILHKFLRQFNYQFDNYDFNYDLDAQYEKIKARINYVNSSDEFNMKNVLMHYLKSSDQYIESFLLYLEYIDINYRKKHLLNFINLIDELRSCFVSLFWFKEYLNHDIIPGKLINEAPFGFNVKINDDFFYRKIQKNEFSHNEQDVEFKYGIGFVKAENIKDYNKFKEQINNYEDIDISNELSEQFLISNLNYSANNKLSVLSLYPYNNLLKEFIDKYHLKAFFSSLEFFLIEKAYEFIKRESPFTRREGLLNKLFTYQNTKEYIIDFYEFDFWDILKSKRYHLYESILLKDKRDEKAYNNLYQSYINNEIVSGEIIKRTNGGLSVNILGIICFLPGSQIENKVVRNYDIYVGKVLDFKIIKVTNETRNIVLSHKILFEEKIIIEKNKFLLNLERGQIFTGIVKNITNYGAFIDLGPTDGLVHITDLSWAKINDPSDIVQIDQIVKVIVLYYDDDKSRIQLGIKQLSEDYLSLKNNLNVGKIIEGNVVGIFDFGMFISLIPGLNALIRFSQIWWQSLPINYRDSKLLFKFFDINKSVKAKVIENDFSNHKIEASIKQINYDPIKVIRKMAIGQYMSGEVLYYNSHGAIVLLSNGLFGILEIKQLSWSKVPSSKELRIEYIQNIISENQQLDFMIKHIEFKYRLIYLGLKQMNFIEWKALSKELVNKIVFGDVILVNTIGMVIELDHGLEGFVYFSELPLYFQNEKFNHLEDKMGFEIGDRVKVRVYGLNTRRITLMLKFIDFS